MTSTRAHRSRRAIAGSFVTAIFVGAGLAVAAPAAAATPSDGTYVGTTNEDHPFTLVLDGGSVVAVDTQVNLWCPAFGTIFPMSMTPIPATPVAADGTFAAEWYVDTDTADPGDAPHIIRTQYAISGQFDENGGLVSAGSPEANAVTMDDILAEEIGDGGCYGEYSFSAAHEGAEPGPEPEPELAPESPAFTSIDDGASFVEGETPRALTGTGVDGAAVTVTSNGDPAGETEVADGAWSIPLAEAIPAGTYELVAVQTVDGLVSSPAAITFTVDSAPAPAPEPSPKPAPDPEPAPESDPDPESDPGPESDIDEDSESLAPTGGSPVLPIALGGALVLAGASAIAIRRIRA